MDIADRFSDFLAYTQPQAKWPRSTSPQLATEFAALDGRTIVLIAGFDHSAPLN